MSTSKPSQASFSAPTPEAGDPQRARQIGVSVHLLTAVAVSQKGSGASAAVELKNASAGCSGENEG